METNTETELTGSNDQSSRETQSQLRKLLLSSQPDNDVWQEAVGQLVSKLHLRTLHTHTTDKEFIECINLVARAQATGSKIAKKKNINLGRYKDRAPIDVNLPQDVEDQKTILNLLSKVKADWCLKFLSDFFQNSIVNKAVISILVKWACKCSNNPAELWTAVISPLPKSNIEEKTQILVMKEFEKYSIEFINQQYCEKTLLEFKELLGSISQTLNQVSERDKFSSSIISTTITYISRLRTEIPASIIDNIFITTISEFSASLKGKEQIKRWEPYRAGLSKSAASAINSLTKLLGPSSADHWSKYRQNFILAFPKFSDDLTFYDSENQFIKIILGIKNDTNISPNADYQTEASVCKLLLNWTTFQNQNNNISGSESIDVLIKNVGKSLGIEYFGNIGTICNYDPVEHNLLDQGSTPTSVTILQKGVILTRPDGSKKILHPAIVK